MKYKGLIYIAASLLLGFALGFATRSYFHPRDRFGFENIEQTVNQLRDRLNLTQRQVREIRTALEEGREEFKDVRKKLRPEVFAIRERVRAKIESILTEEQKVEFLKLREETRQKFKNRFQGERGPFGESERRPRER